MTDDRVVVVTGAGGGIGASIAVTAAQSGWRIGVLDRDEAAAAATVATIGDAAVPLVADVTDEHSIERALDSLAETTGRAAPDALVANAGIVRFGPLLDLAATDFRSVVDVNLTGTYLCARAVARRQRVAQQPGAIVAITSMNGVAPGPNAGAYGASKAGVALLVAQMALEWGPLGIRVNAVAPGLIDAGISEPIYSDPEVRALRSSRVPLGRLGTAADVAAVVLFLLSDEAAYVTGAEIVVDGGITRSVIATLPRPQSVDSIGVRDAAR